MTKKKTAKTSASDSRALFDNQSSSEDSSTRNKKTESSKNIVKRLYIFCDAQTYINWLIDGFVSTFYADGTRVLVDEEITKELIDKVPRMSSAPYLVALKIRDHAYLSSQDLLAKDFIPLSDIESVIYSSNKQSDDLKNKWGALPDVPLDLIPYSIDKSLFKNLELSVKENPTFIEHYQWSKNISRVKNARLIGMMTTFFWTLDLIQVEGKKGPILPNNLFVTDNQTNTNTYEQLFKSICESLLEGSTNDAGFSLLIELVKELEKIDPSDGFSKREILGNIDETRFDEKHREKIRQFISFFEKIESGESRLPSDWYLNKENKDFIFKAILFFLYHPQAIKIQDFRKKTDAMALNIRILSNTLIGFYSSSIKMLKDIKLDRFDRYKQISDIALLISNGQPIRFSSSQDIIRPNKISYIKYNGKTILSQILEELEYFNVLMDLESNYGYQLSSPSDTSSSLTFAKPGGPRVFTVLVQDEYLIIQFTANAVDKKIISNLQNLTHLRPHVYVISKKSTVTIFIEILYNDENYSHHRKQFEELIERSSLIV